MKKVWHTVVAVAWAFLGIRKHSEAAKDVGRITPLSIVVIGLVATMIFVAGLIGLVNLVVTKL